MAGNDRDQHQLTSLFVRQFLGMEKMPPLGSVPMEATSAQAEVNINLRGMVHNIRQSIWVHSAEIAKRIEDQLAEACSEASIDKEIARAVAHEVAQPIRDAAKPVSWGDSVLSRTVLSRIPRAAGIAKAWGPKPRLYPAVDVQRALHALPHIARVSVEAEGPGLKIRCVAHALEPGLWEALREVVDQILPPGTRYSLSVVGNELQPAKPTLLLKK